MKIIYLIFFHDDDSKRHDIHNISEEKLLGIYQNYNEAFKKLIEFWHNIGAKIDSDNYVYITKCCLDDDMIKVLKEKVKTLEEET